MNSSHLTDDRIENYSMGKLGEPEIAEVEEHLLFCAECQEQVARMDEFVKAIRTAATRTSTETPSIWGRASALFSLHPGSVWAGAVAVASAIFLVGFLPVTSPDVQYLALSTVRGPESSVPHAKTNAPIDLEFDVTDLPASPIYTIELVDRTGAVVRDFTNEPKSSKLNIRIGEKLRPGQYWIRLYGNSLKTDLLREYALKVD